MKMKESGPPGGRVPGAPLDLPMSYTEIFQNVIQNMW